MKQKFLKSIIDENTIDDRASQELYSIRKKQGKIENAIRGKLSSMLTSKYVQEPIVTIKK